MEIDKGKLFNTWADLCSMVFSDLIEFTRNLLKDGKLSKNEVAGLLNISIDDVDKLLYNELPNVTLKTYLLVLVLNNLTLDVHSIGKSNYDKAEKKLHEKMNNVLQADENLSKKELADLLGISVIATENFLYDYANDKIKYNNIEKELYEKKNAFLDALKESKPDSKYLKQLRELAKTNADNEKLCELIKYYTD